MAKPPTMLRLPRSERRLLAPLLLLATVGFGCEIEVLETRIAELETRLADPNLFSDSARFNAVSTELAAAMEEKSAKEDRWLELEALREELEGD